MKNETKPIPVAILMEKVKSFTNLDRNSIYRIIDKLLNEGQLAKKENGYLIERYLNGPLLNVKKKGIITLNTNLDAYVKLINDKNEEEVYFIHNLNLNNSISGDEVEINLMDKFSNKGVQHAVVTNIISHNTKIVVGTFKLIGSTYEIDLDDKKNYLKIKLDDVSNLVNGHKILIELTYFEKNIAHGIVKKIIGHINDVGNDILSMVYAYNIEPEFEEEIIDYVNNFIPDQKMDEIRKDLTHLDIVSIDPSTSKDLDDAIYVKKHDNFFYLNVNIADVSSYVPYNSILDKKTIERGTSVYLVDRVIPMLPHKLSNDECSLNPNQRKRTLTCDMKIDFEGNIIDIDIYPSWISSRKQLSYDIVNDYFNNKKVDISNNLASMLDDAKELHHVLRKKKNNEGYIDFSLKEPLIVVDEKCFPIEIKIKQRGIAQMMVEDFMVAANNAVTIKAEQWNIPFVYRIHNKPSNEKIDRFFIEIKKTNFIVNKKEFEDINSKTFKKCLEINKNNEGFDILSKLLLRCMSKAEYSTKNSGHFGLALNKYTHFTSPIRRYLDLIVHRLFWMYKFANNLYSDNDRNEFNNKLSELCEISTEKEIQAVNLERDVNTLKFCQYMSKHIGEVFDGIISAVLSFGIFVELDNTIEGLVRIKNIGNDFWVFDENNFSIVGTKTHKTFNFGDKLKIRVIAVNLDLKQIDFEIVGFEKEYKNTLNNKKNFK